MKNIITFKILSNDEGQGLVEYSLIIAFVVLAIIFSLDLFGEGLFLYYQDNIVRKLP